MAERLKGAENLPADEQPSHGEVAPGVEQSFQGDTASLSDSTNLQTDEKVVVDQASYNGSKDEKIPVIYYDYSPGESKVEESLFPDEWKDSNESYNRIAHRIVNIAGEQLRSQNDSKNTLKEKLSAFFRAFLTIQFVAIFLLIAGQMVCKIIWPKYELVSDNIIITFITSVFLETLSGIIMMITYAFNSKDEVRITQILSDVIKNYKKNSDSDNDD